MFAALAPSQLGASSASRRLVVTGAVLTVMAALAAYGLYAAAAVGGSLGDAFSADAWGKVASTRTGRFLLVRLVLSALSVAVLATARRRSSSWWQSAAVAVSIGLVMTFPAAGHPSAATPAALWQVLDGVHFGFVVVWLGGLVLFTLGGRAWFRDTEGEAVVRRFSTIATVAVPVIVVTGTLQAIELAGGLDAITETDWGRRLLVKVSIVAVLVALGGVSRWLLRASGAASLRRTVAAEAVVGLLVLGVTAAMLDLPPVAVAKSQVFNTAITEAGVLADVTVTPGRVGTNEVHVVLTPPGGSLTPIVAATARVALPERDIPAAPVELTLIGSNHYTGVITFPYTGQWRLDLVVEVTAGSTVLLRTTIPVP
jgi:copper transport protein